MNITLTWLGGGCEVGSMGILVDTGTERFLWDYGINVQTMEPPIEPKLPLNGIFPSHAHLDHIGHIPYLYKKGYSGMVYATPTTLDLAGLLLRDSIKVQKKNGLEPSYLLEDVNKMERNSKMLGFNKKISFESSAVELRNAGHIPGSSAILLESHGQKILYTGDTKFIDTELMKKADTSYKDIDAVICEATYSYKNHPNREALADSLKRRIQETVYNNGIVLLPCFAVGRTQEMLSIVSDLGLPIYLDGMGIQATNIVLRHPESVRNPQKLKKAFGQAKKIKNQIQRKQAIKKPCIIITTAGMLNGGPVSYYIKTLHNREDCSMFLSGYQVQGSVGRTLLDTGRYVNEGLNIKPRMRTEFMDFSAHCGKVSILNFLEKTNPKKVFLIHGDRNPEFARELKKMGFDAHAPKNGEKVKI